MRKKTKRDVGGRASLLIAQSRELLLLESQHAHGPIANNNSFVDCLLHTTARAIKSRAHLTHRREFLSSSSITRNHQRHIYTHNNLNTSTNSTTSPKSIKMTGGKAAGLCLDFYVSGHRFLTYSLRWQGISRKELCSITILKGRFGIPSRSCPPSSPKGQLRSASWCWCSSLPCSSP